MESHLLNPGIPVAGRARERQFRIEELYDEFAEATYTFFLNKTRSRAAAADLNQNLYLRVMQSLDIYRGECSWRTWIFAIARNVLADARREYWRKLGERHVTLDGETLATDLGNGTNADDRALHVLLRRRLARCLRLLDDLARVVIIAHYFDGVTLRELTEKMRLDNASGSRAVLLSGQRKLRKCLTERVSDDG